jgi:hypothetical protein
VSEQYTQPRGDQSPSDTVLTSPPRKRRTSLRVLLGIGLVVPIVAGGCTAVTGQATNDAAKATPSASASVSVLASASPTPTPTLSSDASDSGMSVDEAREIVCAEYTSDDAEWDEYDCDLVPDPASAEPTKKAKKPVEPKLGQTQSTDLGKATVYDVDFPVAGTGSAQDIRSKGKQFAVVDIKVCANGTEDDDGYNFDASNFELTDKDSRTYDFWNVQIGARSPNLMDSVNGNDAQRKGSCKRGWLTFQLPAKTKIKSVDYNPSGGTPLTWRV